MNPAPRSYVCYRASRPLTLNGKVDDAAWTAAPWTEPFVDIEGAVRPTPRFLTRARMLWDDRFFYVGADLVEPHVWATLTERDSVIFHDNDFEVFIDPDGDNHQYFEIEINALNTVWDLRLVKPYRDGGPALTEWDAVGMKTAVHVDGTLNDPSGRDRGWSLEMAIPWTALAEFAGVPCPPRDGDRWRINFSRVEWDIEVAAGVYRKVERRPEHNWVWSPQGVIDMHRPERWGFAQFSSARPGDAVFLPDPSLPAREVLMDVYYAQRDFQQTRNRWASSMKDLGIRFTPSSEMPSAPVLRLTPDGYAASVELRLATGERERWSIRQDSRLWRE
jgi:hypothetical protein